jgi:hypothetical protein
MRNPSCPWVRARLPLDAGPAGDEAGLFGPEHDPGVVVARYQAGAEPENEIEAQAGASSRIGEGQDLDAEERLAIAAHLQVCDACRSYRDQLLDSFTALSMAAIAAPVDPHAPSLWPGLQQRIAAAEHTRQRARLRPLRRFDALAARIRDFAESERATGFRSRLVWGRDTLVDAFDHLAGVFPSLVLNSSRKSSWILSLRPRFVFRIVGAALLIGCAIELESQWIVSRSALEVHPAPGTAARVPRLAADSEDSLDSFPGPDNSTDADFDAEKSSRAVGSWLVGLDAEDDDPEGLEGDRLSGREDDDDSWSQGLAQAEASEIQVPVGDPLADEPTDHLLAEAKTIENDPGAGLSDASAVPAPSPGSQAGSAGSISQVHPVSNASPSRNSSTTSVPLKFNFDLERGTPMGPEFRDVKPAY